MPRMNVPDATYPTMKHQFKWGRITKLYYNTDEADIEIVNKDDNPTGEVYSRVPIFFHCNPSSSKRNNGALEGGASAFAVGDIAIVRFEDGKPLIVGWRDGKRECGGDEILVWLVDDLQSVNLDFYNGYKYNQIQLYSIAVDKDGNLLSPKFIRSWEPEDWFPTDFYDTPQAGNEWWNFREAYKTKNPYPTKIPIINIEGFKQNYTNRRAFYGFPFTLRYCIGGTIREVRYYIMDFGVGTPTEHLGNSLYIIPAVDYRMWISGYGWLPFKGLCTIGKLRETGEIEDYYYQVSYDTKMVLDWDNEEIIFYNYSLIWRTYPFSPRSITRFIKKKFAIREDWWELVEERSEFRNNPSDKPDWFDFKAYHPSLIDPDDYLFYNPVLKRMQRMLIGNKEGYIWVSCACAEKLYPQLTRVEWIEGNYNLVGQYEKETNLTCDCLIIDYGTNKCAIQDCYWTEYETPIIEPFYCWKEVGTGNLLRHFVYCFPSFFSLVPEYHIHYRHCTEFDITVDGCVVIGPEDCIEGCGQKESEKSNTYFGRNLDNHPELYPIEEEFINHPSFSSLIHLQNDNLIFAINRWGEASFLRTDFSIRIKDNVKEDLSHQIGQILQSVPDFLKISWIS